MDEIMKQTRINWHHFLSNFYLILHDNSMDRELKAAFMKKAYTHTLKTMDL
ncbi:hypothetical protein SAMN03159341_101751 [Paenibacillus sp. 1_12]|uniref:hypothetical protein n=1 Tax=Paenibacillus sp. 1_12 TaxID=1566278 RepID=UPI0008F0F082|nr:hypothetical protein [Paenibacillus sp. 1_12]SFK82507.1 hypothetical protein SAMN03159341_101751 [Paenibacillus sp. 1_12]